jgi:hypothetical protein
MQSDNPFNGGAVKQYPPVAPPSARHIAQLFLVPGLIVTVFLLGYLGWKRFSHSWYSPENFLKKLDNSNPDVRWRAAEDLAQVLLRDDELAADGTFALQLSERLRRAIDANRPAEKEYAEKVTDSLKAKGPGKEPPPLGKELESERNYIEYLIACLGSFAVPVGAPALCDVATKSDGVESEAIAHRRVRAVWALANLGDNLQRFDRLTPQQKEKALAGLQQMASSSEHGEWARAASRYVESRLAGAPDAMGVDEALAKCAKESDPFLRLMVALALSYWQGDAEENARMEQTLATLLHDDGHGSKDNSELVGLEIRSQAAVALTRRGSSKIKLERIREMLDEKGQTELFGKRLKNDEKGQKESLAFAAVSGMIKAVAELHRKDPKRDLSPLYPALRQLAESGNATLKTEAKQTLIELGQG